MDPNPFLRNSFWTITIGTTFLWTSGFSIHPGVVQRFVALPTYGKARTALIYFIVGLCVVKALTGIIGMLLYAKYKDCDPVSANVSTIIYTYISFHEISKNNIPLMKWTSFSSTY